MNEGKFTSKDFFAFCHSEQIPRIVVILSKVEEYNLSTYILHCIQDDTIWNSP